MEIPGNIKALYRHWDLHVCNEEQGGAIAGIPPELHWFIQERIHIWEKKASGERLPYTTNDILTRYRFCNIFREFDRQTIEFHTFLNPLRDDFPLWLLNMFYCRLVARTETIRHVGLLSYNKKENDDVYEKLMSSPRPRFGTPYVFPVSTIQKSATPTRELFLTQYVPSVMQKIAHEIERWKEISVYDGVASILPIFGFNLSFLWTEVLIDVAYQFPHRISLFKRFPIGPGSLPTLKKLDPGERDASIFVQKLGAMRMPVDVTYTGKRLVLSAENWEGIGCEFRKFRNLTQGKGRRRLYKMFKSPLSQVRY